MEREENKKESLWFIDIKEEIKYEQNTFKILTVTNTNQSTRKNVVGSTDSANTHDLLKKDNWDDQDVIQERGKNKKKRRGKTEGKRKRKREEMRTKRKEIKTRDKRKRKEKEGRKEKREKKKKEKQSQKWNNKKR